MDIRENMGELKSSISMPSYESSYSIAIQYLKTWFLSKFNEDFFKTFHVAGKHVLSDYRNFTINDTLKKEKPAAAMVVNVDYDHDRENIDTYQFGIEHYIHRSKLDRSFFRDYNNNSFIGLHMEEMRMNCTFRIKLSEKAQQLRLYKYMQMAFRIKSTQTNYLNVDFHIPYSLMLQLAKDSGFELVEDDIKDKVGFLSYLNRHSQLPILMKYRNINGKVEFFIRIPELFSHIYIPNNISVDEGDLKGQIYSSFMLEMEVEFRMPIPKFYSYYSMNKQDLIDSTNTLHNSNVSLDLCTIVIPNIPDTNEKGWEALIKTQVEEEDLSKPLVLNLEELFKNNEILPLIEKNNELLISSDVFLDFKIYNNGLPVEYIVNWRDMTITSTKLMVSYITTMFVYIDMEYINANRLSKELDKKRVEEFKKTEE